MTGFAEQFARLEVEEARKGIAGIARAFRMAVDQNAGSGWLAKRINDVQHIVQVLQGRDDLERLRGHELGLLQDVVRTYTRDSWADSNERDTKTIDLIGLYTPPGADTHPPARIQPPAKGVKVDRSRGHIPVANSAKEASGSALRYQPVPLPIKIGPPRKRSNLGVANKPTVTLTTTAQCPPKNLSQLSPHTSPSDAPQLNSPTDSTCSEFLPPKRGPKGKRDEDDGDYIDDLHRAIDESTTLRRSSRQPPPTQRTKRPDKRASTSARHSDGDEVLDSTEMPPKKKKKLPAKRSTAPPEVKELGPPASSPCSRCLAAGVVCRESPEPGITACQRCHHRRQGCTLASPNVRMDRLEERMGRLEEGQMKLLEGVVWIQEALDVLGKMGMKTPSLSGHVTLARLHGALGDLRSTTGVPRTPVLAADGAHKHPLHKDTHEVASETSSPSTTLIPAQDVVMASGTSHLSSDDASTSSGANNSPLSRSLPAHNTPVIAPMVTVHDPVVTVDGQSPAPCPLNPPSLATVASMETVLPAGGTAPVPMRSLLNEPQAPESSMTDPNLPVVSDTVTLSSAEGRTLETSAVPALVDLPTPSPSLEEPRTTLPDVSMSVPSSSTLPSPPPEASVHHHQQRDNVAHSADDRQSMDICTTTSHPSLHKRPLSSEALGTTLSAPDSTPLPQSPRSPADEVPSSPSGLRSVDPRDASLPSELSTPPTSPTPKPPPPRRSARNNRSDKVPKKKT
ncbi:hypothetical protein ONZ45_g18446 [Pleurotus djamor]|nr:hypothetical protein ONZ45_g18446 [Pleurotus djamor]